MNGELPDDHPLWSLMPALASAPDASTRVLAARGLPAAIRAYGPRAFLLQTMTDRLADDPDNSVRIALAVRKHASVGRLRTQVQASLALALLRLTCVILPSSCLFAAASSFLSSNAPPPSFLPALRSGRSPRLSQQPRASALGSTPPAKPS